MTVLTHNNFFIVVYFNSARRVDQVQNSSLTYISLGCLQLIQHNHNHSQSSSYIYYTINLFNSSKEDMYNMVFLNEASRDTYSNPIFFRCFKSTCISDLCNMITLGSVSVLIGTQLSRLSLLNSQIMKPINRLFY